MWSKYSSIYKKNNFVYIYTFNELKYLFVICQFQIKTEGIAFNRLYYIGHNVLYRAKYVVLLCYK